MARRQPDSFAYHEALDRARIVAGLAETLLIAHPAIQAHRRWARRAARAASELRALEQAIRDHSDGTGREQDR